jgi:hypothetical protein
MSQRSVFTLGLMAAAVAGVLASASSAQAATIKLTDGNGTVVTVADDGVGDSALGLGSINYVGNAVFGNWNILITTGVTKPAFGSATSPAADLAITANKTGGGASSLYILFSDTGFGPFSGNLALDTSHVLTNATYTYKVYGDSANSIPTLSGTGVLSSAGSQLASTGVSAGNGAESAVGSTAALTSPYALSQFVVISAGEGSAFNSSDSRLAVVPVPAAAWAGFSMLGGLGFFKAVRRRRMA